jgi:methylmalonyl-CoA mutase N-terminal domain/subunit
MRLAERARERKEQVDAGERVVVGVNRYQRIEDREGFGEVFRLDPKNREHIVEKYVAVKDRRDNAAAEQTLMCLGTAAQDDSENLMPYLVDCCHAYVTIGEMVQELKTHWGEFQEPALAT